MLETVLETLLVKLQPYKQQVHPVPQLRAREGGGQHQHQMCVDAQAVTENVASQVLAWPDQLLAPTFQPAGLQAMRTLIVKPGHSIFHNHFSRRGTCPSEDRYLRLRQPS